MSRTDKQLGVRCPGLTQAAGQNGDGVGGRGGHLSALGPVAMPCAIVLRSRSVTGIASAAVSRYADMGDATVALRRRYAMLGAHTGRSPAQQSLRDARC
eukprot:3362806-Rhodomonas_salina.1